MEETSTDVSTAAAAISDSSGSVGASGSSRLQPFMKKALWGFLALFCLIFFTVLKLPEDRVRNFVQGTISSQLASEGISFSADKSTLSIGFGISYTMKDVSLVLPPPQDPVHIEEISVSPSLLALLTGKMGGSLHLENKGGTLDANYSQSIGNGGGPISLKFTAKNLDLGSLGLLPLLASTKGSALVNGEGQLSGQLSIPTSLQGSAALDFSKIIINQQSIMGFSIPQLSVSEAKADLAVEGGKAVIKTFRLGKSASSPNSSGDDIRGSLSGDMTLGKNWQYSTLNLKTEFTLSQTVLKSFVLLDALLGAGKTSEASYSFLLNGPISAPNFVPAGTPAVPQTVTPPTTPPHSTATDPFHPGVVLPPVIKPILPGAH